MVWWHLCELIALTVCSWKPCFREKLIETLFKNQLLLEVLTNSLMHFSHFQYKFSLEKKFRKFAVNTPYETFRSMYEKLEGSCSMKVGISCRNWISFRPNFPFMNIHRNVGRKCVKRSMFPRLSGTAENLIRINVQKYIRKWIFEEIVNSLRLSSLSDDVVEYRREILPALVRQTGCWCSRSAAHTCTGHSPTSALCVW